MRIIFVNEKCRYFGGVEQNIADTVRGFSQRGHSCYLAYTEKNSPDNDYAGLFSGVYSFELRDKNSIMNLPEADAVYFHKIPFLPELSVFNHHGKKPVLVRMVHDHDLICPRRHRYFALPPYRNCHFRAGWRCWLDGAFLRRGENNKLTFFNLRTFFREMSANKELDTIITASCFMREALLQNGFRPERVKVVSPAVRDIYESPDAGGGAKEADVPLLLYVGQLIRGKGVDLLLRAAALLKCSFKLAIVGRGNAESALKEQAGRLFPEERVKFYGWISQAELHQLYQQARVCAVPSRWSEPYGLIGLEAMNHAKPVVAFAVGGIQDWLVHNKTGFLIPERDINLYAKNLELLLTDEKLAAKMGFQGREHVQKEFSFPVYLNRLEQLLKGEAGA